MNTVLAIYSKEAFREYILPSEMNADYTIKISKEQFNLKKDVQLQFEVMNGLWELRNATNCKISCKTEEGKQFFLRNQDVFQVSTNDNEKFSLIVREEAGSFRSYKKYALNRLQSISIGKDEKNDIVYDFLGLVSKVHVRIVKKNNSFVIQNESKNGTYVNSIYISGEKNLEFGDFINVMGLHMVFLGDVLAVDVESEAINIQPTLQRFELSDPKEMERGEISLSEGKTIHHRSPRSYERPLEDEIEIEEPPQLNKQKQKPLFMTIGPSITMAFPMLLGCVLMIYASNNTGGGTSLYMYSGLIMSVSSALVGVTWTLLGIKYQKREEKEQEEQRLSKYGDYLVEKTKEIKELYENEEKKLIETYPATNVCMDYDANVAMLWNRNRTHEDFLQHRLGTGDLPFPVHLSVPKKKFSMSTDELAEKPAYIKENYKVMYEVPIVIDLIKNNLIGIVGGKGRQGALQIAKIIATQIAANNCYTDVKLGFIYNDENEEEKQQWEFVKWLPHVWSEDKKTRYVAMNKTQASEIFYEFTRICRSRTEDDNKKGLPKPYYVVFVSESSMLEGELFSKYVFDRDPVCGFTVIFLAEDATDLPNSCDFIIENTSEFCGMYNVFEDKKEWKAITFDQVNDEKLETFSRRLASIQVQEMEEGGEIPASLTFFEMLKVNQLSQIPVRELWAKNKIYENIKGIIGEKAGGAPCYLDVHEKYHGPHGLVAGTTGSGKSETLQTYMLSLAVNYSPDDIGFFIIDYKGGGMANLFNGLPHMVGQISNLSGNQVRRAMISIKSENRRRQKVFTENGVNNINAYTKLYKSGEAVWPVPHLFIIIDEFAELKREEPEFMKELISVAQVGRSLGVHLILATQKPSGTVDDNIWSNSKFRLCLRVQDQQDSKDMLHKPDAAYITQAGRCYLQVGNDEVYELFQSGFSGAIYDENAVNISSDIARMLTVTGKTEIRGNAVRQQQRKYIEKAWIENLITCLKAAEEITKLDLAMCIHSEQMVMQFVKEMYEQLRIRELEYGESEYNSTRLKDFLKVYVRAKNLVCEEDLAEEIIKQATYNHMKLPQPKERTQLDAVKEYLAVKAKEYGYNYKLQLWMPVLPDKIYLHDMEEFAENSFDGRGWINCDNEWRLAIPVGMLDDPENQNQMPLEVDFAKEGHVAIIGNIVSGKSTMMQTMAYALIQKYSPDMVHIYGLDFSSKMMSAFEDAPHVGGVMYESDIEKIGKFFNMINTILSARKKMFKGGNYKQYVQVNGYEIPSIVIFIDNYSAFKEKTGEAYEEDLIRLSKEGISHGIFLIVSGAGYGMNDITTRVGENIGRAICLSLQDKYAYADFLHTMQIDVMPETGIKGRGLALYETRVLEYQAALAIEAQNDYERMEEIRNVCQKMRKAWKGKMAKKIPEIPEKPVWSEFSTLDEFKEESAVTELIPVGYDEANAAVYSVNLRDIYCYLITGGARSGKTNYMKVFLQSVLAKDEAHICVMDSPKAEFKAYASDEKIDYCITEEEIFAFFKNLLPEFKRRNVMKNQMLEQEKEEEEILDCMMKETPYFVFISDLNWFVPFIYQATLDMKGFLENIISKGRLHNIYFISELDLKNRNNLLGYQIYESFVSYKTGIHFGGKTAENTVFSFDYMSYAEQNKPEKVGVGLLPNISDKNSTKKVIVPRARR